MHKAHFQAFFIINCCRVNPISSVFLLFIIKCYNILYRLSGFMWTKLRKEKKIILYNSFKWNYFIIFRKRWISKLFRLTQSVVKAAEQISQIPFFKLNQNVWVHIYLDEIHSEIKWGKRLWTTFKTFLPSDGEPQMPSATEKSVSNRSNSNCVTYRSLSTVFTVIFLMMKNG